MRGHYCAPRMKWLHIDSDLQKSHIFLDLRYEELQEQWVGGVQQLLVVRDLQDLNNCSEILMT